MCVQREFNHTRQETKVETSREFNHHEIVKERSRELVVLPPTLREMAADQGYETF